MDGNGLARKALVVTLFLIGSSLTEAMVRNLGWRPLAQGTALWILVSLLTLGAILGGMIS